MKRISTLVITLSLSLGLFAIPAAAQLRGGLGGALGGHGNAGIGGGSLDGGLGVDHTLNGTLQRGDDGVGLNTDSTLNSNAKLARKQKDAALKNKAKKTKDNAGAKAEAAKQQSQDVVGEGKDKATDVLADSKQKVSDSKQGVMSAGQSASADLSATGQAAVGTVVGTGLGQNAMSAGNSGAAKSQAGSQSVLRPVNVNASGSGSSSTNAQRSGSNESLSNSVAVEHAVSASAAGRSLSASGSSGSDTSVIAQKQSRDASGSKQANSKSGSGKLIGLDRAEGQVSNTTALNAINRNEARKEGSHSARKESRKQRAVSNSRKPAQKGAKAAKSTDARAHGEGRADANAGRD